MTGVLKRSCPHVLFWCSIQWPAFGLIHVVQKKSFVYEHTLLEAFLFCSQEAKLNVQNQHECKGPVGGSALWKGCSVQPHGRGLSVVHDQWDWFPDCGPAVVAIPRFSKQQKGLMWFRPCLKESKSLLNYQCMSRDATWAVDGFLPFLSRNTKEKFLFSWKWSVVVSQLSALLWKRKMILGNENLSLTHEHYTNQISSGFLQCCRCVMWISVMNDCSWALLLDLWKVRADSFSQHPPFSTSSSRTLMPKQLPALGAAGLVVAVGWKAKGEGLVEPGRVFCAKGINP